MFINMLLIKGFVGWWKNIVDKSKFDIKFIIYYLYKCKKKIVLVLELRGK